MTSSTVVNYTQLPVPPRSDGMCAHCGKRKGAHLWGDALAVTHGWAQKHCGVCVYRAQLGHAANRAVRIPLLSWRLVRAWVTRS